MMPSISPETFCGATGSAAIRQTGLGKKVGAERSSSTSHPCSPQILAGVRQRPLRGPRRVPEPCWRGRRPVVFSFSPQNRRGARPPPAPQLARMRPTQASQFLMFLFFPHNQASSPAHLPAFLIIHRPAPVCPPSRPLLLFLEKLLFRSCPRSPFLLSMVHARERRLSAGEAPAAISASR